MRRRFLGWSVVLLLVIMVSQARSYLVPRALPLDQLARQSDLVIKAVALGSEPVQDAAFAEHSGAGFGVFATRLKVVSVLKGNAELKEITFHHYDKLPGQRYQGPGPLPQSYHFTPKQPYLLFAKKSEQPDVFRTFRFNHTSQLDQGQIRAADEEPIAAETSVKAAVWRELTKLAASDDSPSIVYAIDHLNVLSSNPWYDRDPKIDFPREDVLRVICPFLAHKDSEVVHAALLAVGRASPYWSNDLAQGWLATVGKGNFLRRGYGTYPDNYRNPSAFRCRKELVALAQTSSSTDIRALAIRALGRSRENDQDTALLQPLQQWTADSAAPVRAAAAVLWSDYPSPEASAALRSLADDKAPAVRTAAAYAIGFSQVADLLPVVDRLLADSDKSTRHAAALSLLSFDPRVAGPILKAHIRDKPYSVAFINALAEADPAAYRDYLVAILKSDPPPESNLSGQVSSFTAWEVLMKYITTVDAADLRAGKFDTYLDALETPPNVGSGPYQTLYQFYHDRGLTARTQSFPPKARTQVQGYSLDEFFKEIDRHK